VCDERISTDSLLLIDLGCGMGVTGMLAHTAAIMKAMSDSEERRESHQPQFPSQRSTTNFPSQVSTLLSDIEPICNHLGSHGGNLQRYIATLPTTQEARCTGGRALITTFELDWLADKESIADLRRRMFKRANLCGVNHSRTCAKAHVLVFCADCVYEPLYGRDVTDGLLRQIARFAEMFRSSGSAAPPRDGEDGDDEGGAGDVPSIGPADVPSIARLDVVLSVQRRGERDGVPYFEEGLRQLISNLKRGEETEMPRGEQSIDADNAAKSRKSCEQQFLQDRHCATSMQSFAFERTDSGPGSHPLHIDIHRHPRKGVRADAVIEYEISFTRKTPSERNTVGS